MKEDGEKRPQRKQAKKQEDEEFVEEMDSDEEETNIPEAPTNKSEDPPNIEQKITETQKEGAEKSTLDKNEGLESPEKKEDKSKEEKKEVQKKVFGPMRPPENYVLPESYFNQESDRDLPEIMEDEM